MALPPTRAARLSLAAAGLTLGLKVLAWKLTGSAGLLADAAETVVNVAAAGLTLFMVALARKPADHAHPFGHWKAEYMASLAEGAFILLAAVSIAWTSAQRLLNPQPLTSLGLGLGIAVLAAAINYAVARQLLLSARAHQSIALEADAKHLLTDVWTTAGVVAGLGVAGLRPGWNWLDPCIALALAVHIAWAGGQMVRRSFDGLLDHALPDGELAELVAAIREHMRPGMDFHGLRTRCSGPQCFVDFHLLVPGRMTVSESHQMAENLEQAIRTCQPRVQVTIHVEPIEDKSSFDAESVGGLTSATSIDAQEGKSGKGESV